MATAASSTATGNYYDIVLLGKTGMGKSTLGNKLLQYDAYRNGRGNFFTKFLKDGVDTGNFHGFDTADDIRSSSKTRYLSVTEECELVANENTEVRVLDTPGFANSSLPREDRGSVYDANLQIFRWLFRVVQGPRNNMNVRRILYFLPVRGVPEKADGGFLQELQLLYDYFGTSVFNYMVFIATNHPLNQQYPFTDEMISKTEEIISVAIAKVTMADFLDCPPVIYVGKDVNEGDIVRKIKGANVFARDGTSFMPEFKDGTCSKCDVKIRFSQTSQIVGIIKKQVGNAGNEETLEDCDASKCHPSFIPKYTKVCRVIGGLAHMGTLGVPCFFGWVCETKTWPGFNNSEKICANCERFPGSEGCRSIKTKGESIDVKHTINSSI